MSKNERERKEGRKKCGGEGGRKGRREREKVFEREKEKERGLKG